VQQLTSGALLDAVRGAHWPARRVARGVYQGGHRSRRVGSSPEFMQYRQYHQGDDTTRIDWKLFGRTERLAIRQTHDDARLRTTVLVDASESMAYPGGTLAKWEFAASIALGLCSVAHGDGDPVGIVIAGGDDHRTLPPRTRAGTVANVLRMLMETTPGGSGPLGPELLRLRANRRIAIVSDFLGDADALLEHGKEMVASGREIFAIHVVAREELDPNVGGSVVVDPEDAEVRRPLGESALAEYRETFARWREQLAADWRAAGAYYQLAIADDAAARVVRHIVSPGSTSAAAS
jgi:uncharacterized protein (DUF58 family)